MAAATTPTSTDRYSAKKRAEPHHAERVTGRDCNLADDGAKAEAESRAQLAAQHLEVDAAQG